LAAWPPAAPLFVGADGERISRGTLQYRVLRAFRRAGIDADRARGALVHGLRHTFATELANSDVSVYTLMKLLGHESMVTSQRYVTAAGTETRTAAPKQAIRPLDRGSLSRIGATSGPRPYRVGLSIMSIMSINYDVFSVMLCCNGFHQQRRSGADGARHTSKLSP
jgi:hypothetical protein